MTEQPQISVVSPVYGCRGCLEALADAVRAAFDGSGLTWELVLVDDRGPDNPWSLIAEMAARDSRIRGVRLTRNHGQHLAIWAGLERARGDWVAVIDCDLQDDPAVLTALYARAQAEPVEAVVVERGDWQDNAFRRIGSRLFYRIIDLLGGIRLPDNTGNFGLYSRRMVDTLLSFGDREVFLPVMVVLTGLPCVTHPVDRSPRHEGQSSYSMMQLLRLAVSIVVRFSDRPLTLSVLVGLTFSGVSALISVLLLLAWATGAFTVPGWTSLILSTWFLAGLVLAVLGVHGVYVGRIFAEVRDRPRILVEQVTASAEEAEVPQTGARPRQLGAGS